MNTKQEDFIRQSVFSACMKEGVPEQASRDQSESAVIMYRRNQFNGKPLDLIKAQVVAAKRINKKVKVKK